MDSRKAKELLVRAVTTFVSLSVAIPLLWIVADVVIKGLPAINFEFFTSLPAPFGETGGGVANAVLGTLVINAMSSLIGIPLGVLTGIYQSEYSGDKRIYSLIRTSIDSLAGVPSIILGLFAFTIIVMRIGHYTALAAAFALALIMIPPVSKATEEGMRSVPIEIREAAIALGLPKWVITLKVVFSIAKGSVITGSLLSFARISGETAPLLFTSLFSYYWPAGINEPMASLQVLIYNYAMSGFGEWVTKAWGASLLLLLIVLMINTLVRAVSKNKGGY